MVAERYLKAAYAGIQKSLQQEWQFLQRVTEGLGNKFWDIKKALQTEFLPALFGGSLADLFGGSLADDVPGRLASLPVKKAGLAIQDPTTNADSNWTASTVICGHLIAAIRGTE
jgi:hypothetical protein